jgi:hypothetical protein
MAADGIQGQPVKQRLQVTEHAGMEQGAVQIAGQQHPRAGRTKPQQGCLQQPRSAIYPKPAGIGSEGLGGPPLGFGHGSMAFKGTAEGRQFGQVPGSRPLAQQTPQLWGQGSASAMAGQMQRQGRRLP